MSDPVTVNVSATRERVNVAVDTVREVVQIKVISDSYALPIASASVLGGIKVGSGLTITAGVLSASGGDYTLPIATDTVLGGIKSSSDILVNVTTGVATVNATSAATPNTIVKRSALGGVNFGTVGASTVTASSGVSTSGATASISTFGQYGYISTEGTDAYIQSRSTFKLFDGDYTTTLSGTQTADRAIAFPNASGTIALTSDIGTVDQTIIDGSANAVAGNAVFDALALKAPLASPTFTGIVTAPRITGRCDGLEVLCKAGLAINAGQVVYVTGASGANIIIGLAQANAEATSSKTIGISQSTLANNANGYVITEGLMAVSISAPSANEGDPIWLSPATAGSMVFGLANKPSAPNHIVYLGVVTRKTGNNVVEIYVKIQNGAELDELSDVSITSPAAGQALMRGATLWQNRSLVSADISDATSAATASKIVLRDATGGASFAATTSNAVEGTATSGNGVYGLSDTGNGGFFQTNSGLSASFFSFGGDFVEFISNDEGGVASISYNGSICTLGTSAYIQSRSTFKLFDGVSTTTLSHSPTADRAIAFPNAGGTLALTSGSQTFSDTQTFSGTLSVTGSFTTSGVITGGGLDISQTWNRPTITVTGASGNGTTATLTFASQATAIPVGATIVVASVNPAGYNATAVVTASTLTSVSYANATSSAYVSGGNITQLFTGIRANFIDSASNASSNVIDLQVGGVSQFKVSKSGSATLGRFATAGFNALEFDAVNGTLKGSRSSGGTVIADLSIPSNYFSIGTLIASNGTVQFGANNDTILIRDAANIVAQRNAAFAQTSRIYNTYTSATNFERLDLRWDSGVAKIGTQKGTTGGTARDLALETDSVERVRIKSTGNVGMGTTSPSSLLHLLGTTEQLRVGYDASNYVRTTVNSSGLVTLNAVGAGAGFVFSNSVRVNSDLTLGTAGNKINIAEGSNASVGVATLVAGTVVVNTTAVTANSRIFLTRQTIAGTIGSSVDVTARVAGTSFTITSNGSVLDTSTVAWFIIN